MSSLLLHIVPSTHGVFVIPILFSVALYAVTSTFVKVLYRLTLHPLSRYPGPVLAASTNLYSGYYDIFREGGIVRRLPKLHSKYGPVIRIAPDELHVFEFDSFNEIFKAGTKYTKPSVSSTDTLSSSFLHISSPQEAKLRKDNYRPFFSTSAIRRLEPLLHSILCKWLGHLREVSNNESVIDISRAFKCFSLDVVTQLSFAQDVGGVHAQGFLHPIIEASAALDDAFTLSKYFPTLKAAGDGIASLLPASLARKVLPGAADLKEYIASCRAHLENLSNDYHEANHSKPTIFQNVMNPVKISPENPPLSLDLLTADAVLMISAGMSTTAYTAQVGCWHLLQQPAIAERLLEELSQAIPELRSDWNPLPLDQLEQLPFLKAVIKESLRLSYGVPGRMTRLVPAGGTTVAGIFVPAGTLLSHSTSVYHHDEAIFPDSFSFHPDRWLGDDAAVLERHLLSFSKGSRSCLGIKYVPYSFPVIRNYSLMCTNVPLTWLPEISLAYAQLTLLFAMLYRCFEVNNAGTTEKDMEWKDRFVPKSNNTLKVKLIAR